VDFMAALKQASILRLKKGLCHTAHRGGGFVCLVLSGAIREHGVGAIAGPGSFVGAGTLIDRFSIPSSFVVLEDAEVLVFDQSYMKRAGRRVLDDRAVQEKAGPCGTPL
ncbi:MAG: hypothetical protein RBS57_21875, partial [Desulforhabdus sp.]|nr:hypothetical protein [Desulforhabdus sp.]